MTGRRLTFQRYSVDICLILTHIYEHSRSVIWYFFVFYRRIIITRGHWFQLREVVQAFSYRTKFRLLHSFIPQNHKFFQFPFCFFLYHSIFISAREKIPFRTLSNGIILSCVNVADEKKWNLRNVLWLLQPLNFALITFQIQAWNNIGGTADSKISVRWD